MGYKAENLQEGFTMMTACFVPVSDADKGVDLLDLTVGGTYSSGAINIQTLTSAGLADKTYTFGYNRKTKVWYWQNDDGDAVEEGMVTFAPGAGLWVQGVDGATITIPGPKLK